MNVDGIPIRFILGAIGGLVALVALGWLIHSRDHYQSLAQTNELKFEGEQTAHQQTIANYKVAAVQAQKADAANVTRVQNEDATKLESRSSEYEARIAAANAQYERLQHSSKAAAANSGLRGGTPVSAVSPVPSGAAETSCQNQLSDSDALTATKQAIQLDELIKAVNDVSSVNVNGNRSDPK